MRFVATMLRQIACSLPVTLFVANTRVVSDFSQYERRSPGPLYVANTQPKSECLGSYRLFVANTPDRLVVPGYHGCELAPCAIASGQGGASH